MAPNTASGPCTNQTIPSHSQETQEGVLSGNGVGSPPALRGGVPGSSAAVAMAGEYVVLFGTSKDMFGVVLSHGTITNNRFGSFHHDDIIGQSYGLKVQSRKGTGWLVVLRATPELITQSLPHRTQILYHADISTILMLLDAHPGKIVVEAGTGSGSLSSSIARALRPGGTLHTFEFHEDRQRQAVNDFDRYGLRDVINSRHGDVCKDGFGDLPPGSVDGVFLDLPMPWLAIPHADRALVEGGKICCFSPCIEQVDKSAAELRQLHFHDVRMVETLAMNWGVKATTPSKRRRVGTQKEPPQADASLNACKTGAMAAADGSLTAEHAPAAGQAVASRVMEPDTPCWVSYQMPMRSHTGFLLFATKPAVDEP